MKLLTPAISGILVFCSIFPFGNKEIISTHKEAQLAKNVQTEEVGNESDYALIEEELDEKTTSMETESITKCSEDLDGSSECMEVEEVSEEADISQTKSESETVKEDKTSESENEDNSTKETQTKPKKQAEVKEVEPETETTRQNSSNHGAYIGKFKITGYTAEEGFYYGKQTASYDTHGYTCKPGICAMNSQRRRDLGLNYGDQIYIEGLGTYTVADCGCNYNVVDIWVYTDAEAANLTSYRDVYYA